jgi:hypothetical protein
MNNPYIHRLVADLDAWRLLPLMTFQHNWNDEIISQFYATLWIDSQNLVLHWLTQGIHYRCDYRTFHAFLGLLLRTGLPQVSLTSIWILFLMMT